jgi:hypothetical protein
MTMMATPTQLPMPVPTAPARCNLAGFCDYCGQLGCQSPRCQGLYDNTWWAVCDRCGGHGGDDYGNACHCVSGVIQVPPGYHGAVPVR